MSRSLTLQDREAQRLFEEACLSLKRRFKTMVLPTTWAKGYDVYGLSPMGRDELSEQRQVVALRKRAIKAERRQIEQLNMLDLLEVA